MSLEAAAPDRPMSPENMAAAAVQFEGTLASNLRDLGADHPQTLVARDMLARCYRVAGRLGEAIGLHEENLPARQRVLGPDHPDTLMSGNDLARTYRLAGRHDDAIGLHERVLASQQRVLGPDHPDTLISRANLASAWQSAGRTDRALPLYEEAVTGQERVLGRAAQGCDPALPAEPGRQATRSGRGPPGHHRQPQQPRRRVLAGREADGGN